jgi:hypothetical protein
MNWQLFRLSYPGYCCHRTRHSDLLLLIHVFAPTTFLTGQLHQSGFLVRPGEYVFLNEVPGCEWGWPPTALVLVLSAESFDCQQDRQK